MFECLRLCVHVLSGLDLIVQRGPRHYHCKLCDRLILDSFAGVVFHARGRQHLLNYKVETATLTAYFTLASPPYISMCITVEKSANVR